MYSSITETGGERTVLWWSALGLCGQYELVTQKGLAPQTSCESVVLVTAEAAFCKEVQELFPDLVTAIRRCHLFGSTQESFPAEKTGLPKRRQCPSTPRQSREPGVQVEAVGCP